MENNANQTTIQLPTELRSKLSPRAKVLTRASGAAYEQARKVWNGDIDKHPAIILQVGGVQDVILAVQYATKESIPTALRSGGHSIPGFSTVEDGLVIDLSQLRGIRVDPTQKRVRVEAGCLLGEVDHATAAFGLACPFGTVSHTGVSGLTLGGGYGWLSRSYGMSIDNLISVDLVLANGDFLTASANENSDLFWGIRGAGANFGVVTSFEFQLHPVKDVYAGVVVFPFDENAHETIKFVVDFTKGDIPHELNISIFVGSQEPPHLNQVIKVISVIFCYNGPKEVGEQVLKPIFSHGHPLFVRSGMTPYVEHQKSADSWTPHGRKYYLKGGYTNVLEKVIASIVTHFKTVPSKHTAIACQLLGGKINSFNVSDTAFPTRDATHSVAIICVWEDDTKTQENKEWARRAYDDIKQYTINMYSNFTSKEDSDTPSPTSYGQNAARLQKLKAQYDPGNFFKFNANILPA